MPNESITTYLAASSQTRYYKQMKCYSESPSDTGIHMDNKQAADQPADPTYLGNKGDGHASKMHTVHPSSQASHCLCREHSHSWGRGSSSLYHVPVLQRPFRFFSVTQQMK